VADAGQLEDYVETALRFGTGRLDALVLATAYEASRRGDDGAADLLEIVILAAALRGTSELALESAAQGRAMLLILRRAWPAEALERLDGLARDGDVEPAHAVVAGVAAAAHGLPLTATLVAFLHGFVANLVSAGVRLVPLGQTDGQRVTATLSAAVLEVAAEAMAGSIDDLGSAAPMIDLLSMKHESQHSRLFRS
jgi:urease accessory protein